MRSGTDATNGDRAMTRERANEGFLHTEDTREVADRWRRVQTRFVDDPRGAVEEADEVLSDAIDRLRRHFDRQREEIARTWRDEHAETTEDLRLTLRNYRSYLARLVPEADIGDETQ